MNSDISFFAEEKSHCPICSNSFHIENMRSRRGRFNSNGIGSDLRRLYTPTKKFGLIYPLVYNVLVCPECWFSALPDDFFEPSNYDVAKLKKNEKIRKKTVAEIVAPNLDFANKRDLNLGIASFLLALTCYNFHNVKSVASAHKFLCALRASWCVADLEKVTHSKTYRNISLYFKKLAHECLNEHLKSMYDTKKKFTKVNYYGPDLDHDYGFDGFIYLNCYLEFLFSDLNKTPKEKYDLLFSIRNRLSKVFGLGKVNRSSPSPLKNAVRNTYDEIKLKIDELEVANPILKEK